MFTVGTGKHIFQNCTIQALPKTAGEKRTRQGTVGPSTRSAGAEAVARGGPSAPRRRQPRERRRGSPEIGAALVFFSMVWYGMVWYGTVRYGTV